MDAPQDERRLVTIVAAFPTLQRCRACNESNTTAVVVLDDRGEGVDLPGRTCVDVAASAITIGQRVDGIPPHGLYLRLD